MPRESLQPNAENASLDDLHSAIAAGSKTTARRVLAILMLITGASRAQAAKAAGCGEATIRNWIRRFNHVGVDALIDNRPGAPRKISPAWATPLRKILAEPERAGRTHWTAKAFHGWLNEHRSIACGYDTVRCFAAE